MHVQSGHNNEQIKCENYGQCSYLIKGGHSEKKPLANTRIRAGEWDQGGQLTIEMIDCIKTPYR